mgnify:CR=1 FL=1
MIQNEIENARRSLPCGITAKVNSLVDPEIIELLYQASTAGVPVRLIVRGICCLIPGKPGISENITVRSIVGRLLEHSRIFLFENAGKQKVFLGSADWMPRNLDRRVELIFPVEEDVLKQRVLRILERMLADNENARVMGPDGTYARVDRRGKAPVSCQTEFMRMAAEAVRKRKEQTSALPFEPIRSADTQPQNRERTEE